MSNWDRQYRLKVTSSDGAGFEIGAPNSQGFALHINFSVQRNNSSTLATARIQVWNLNKSEVETLMKKNCTVTLNAGYGESRPVIFTGTVTDVDDRADAADRVTIISAVDGYAEISETTVSVTYNKNTLLYKVFTDIANKLGLPTSYSASAAGILESTYVGCSYSFVGYARYVLDEIGYMTNLYWIIENGVLQVCQEDECFDEYVHVLNKSTGLVRIPKRISSLSVSMSDEDAATNKVYGYRIEYLMDGSIGIGDKVKIETGNVTGLFRVVDLTIQGDNIQGDWTCMAKVTEI